MKIIGFIHKTVPGKLEEVNIKLTQPIDGLRLLFQGRETIRNLTQKPGITFLEYHYRQPEF